MLYFLILTFILSKNISADSADLVKKASKIKARKRQRFSADSADSADGRLCILLSKIPGKSGICRICRRILCGSHVILHLSDKSASGRRLYCLADFSLFLGMRYLRLLCGGADWKT